MTRKPRKKPTPEQLADKDAKRRKALMTGSMRRVRTLKESQIDPDTGAGVVLVEERVLSTQVELVAYFYKFNQTRIPYTKEIITSNHQRLGVLDRLQVLIDEEAAAKIAPHDLEVGEIICDNWGASMNRPSFLKVLEIPHPRKVKVVRLKDRLVSGDRQVGSVLPIEPHEPDDDPFECMVSMEDGSARLVLGSLSRAYRWNQKPASITSD